MKLLFVVNPVSGGIDKEPFLRYAESVCQKYGISSQVFRTTGEEDAKKLRETLSSFKPSRVASVGGDGTTLFTAIQLKGGDIPFGIVPMGSANGMAEELGVAKDPEVALDDLLKSHFFKKLDLVLVNEQHYCLHIGDVGINARIVKDFSEDERRGMLTYAKYFLKALKEAPQMDFQIEADGEKLEQKGYIIAIANARKYGTGAILNPQGNPFDGKFELVIGYEKNLEAIVNLGLTVFDEEFTKVAKGKVISCKEATIRLQEPHVLQLDGEVIGEVDTIHARIVPAAVRLITHRENPFSKDS